MALAVEENKFFNPMNVAFFGSDAVRLEANDGADLLK